MSVEAKDNIVFTNRPYNAVQRNIGLDYRQAFLINFVQHDFHGRLSGLIRYFVIIIFYFVYYVLHFGNIFGFGVVYFTNSKKVPLALFGGSRWLGNVEKHVDASGLIPSTK